jgi:hypothetical protein
MTEPKAAIAALTFVLLAPHGALAQVASKLEAGSITTQQDGEVPASVFSVAPGIRVNLPYFALAAHGSAWLTGQQWQIADGTLSGTLVTPTVGHFRGEVIGNASRAFFDRSLENDQLDAQARLHMLFSQNSGIWVGGGVARPWRIAVVSAVDVTGGGAWARLGDATLSGTYTNFFFTKVAASRDTSGTAQTCSTHNEPLSSLTSSGSGSLSSSTTSAATDCRRQSRFSDIEGSVNWAYGFLEVTGQAGYRFGDSYDVTPDSRRWAAGTAVLWITNRVAAVMGGGRIPANPSRGLPARNYANFGLMLSYSSIPRTTVPVAPMTIAAVKAFEVRPLATGTQKITVRVGGVETVEVMGDFSDWTPLVLMRRGRDLWDITLPVAAGVHEINLRLDGGPWLAPPGLPTRRDSFSGDVGLLVVP